MHRVVLAFLVMASLLDAAPRVGVSESDEQAIHIAVLYRESTTGQQHLKGAQDAHERHPHKDRFILHPVPYEDEGRGLRTLLDLRAGKWNDQKIDLILGPTDSGVYINARSWEEQEKNETGVERRVPVISSLVTAAVPQDKDSWFFRTNVDVDRRAHVIHDVLRKRLANSATILYEDNEFGRRAEQAFKQEFVRGAPPSNYHAIPFSTTLEARTAAREVVETRPECVGIFARRSFVKAICKQLEDQKSGLLSFEPLIFSILDLHLILDELPPIYFVSVARPGPSLASEASEPSPEERWEDIRALSYDTTQIVLGTIQTSGVWNPTDFRTSFAAVLQGGSKIPGPRTGMNFANYENTSSPLVCHSKADGSIAMLDPSSALTVFEQLRFKVGLIMNRYGWKPAFVLAFVLAATFYMNYRDIHRWYGGSQKKILRNRWFAAFSGFNILVVVSLYVYLSESGRITYDSFLSALLVVLAPAAVIKSTWFETAGGKAFGPRQLYNKLLTWFNEKLTVEMYANRARQEEVLVGFNSLHYLENRIRAIYTKERPAEKSEALRQALKSELEAAPTDDDKRRVCAEHLLRRLPWSELVALGCVPRRFENPDTEEDPIADVKQVVEKLLDNRVGSAEVDRYIRSRLSNASPRLAQVYERKLEESDLERGRLFRQISFLIFQFGMSRKEFLDIDRFREEIDGISGKSREKKEDPTLLGQLMVEAGKLKANDLGAALETQKKTRDPLGKILVASGAIAEDTLSSALKQQAKQRGSSEKKS